MKSLLGRYSFLVLMVILLGCESQPGPSKTGTATADFPGTTTGHQDYVVHQQLTLVNSGPAQPEKQNLWVALVRDFPPYQQVRSMSVSPDKYTRITDELGNQYAEFDFSGQPAGSTQIVRIDYLVTVNELSYDLSNCRGDLPTIFTQPELHIESANPGLVRLANDLSKGMSTACEQVRAFYEYIGDTLTYTYNGANWGAEAALGPMGADCTEYSDLFVALSRAKGIPARYFEGLFYLRNSSDTRARTEHAWTDVYMPSLGWVPIDPTLGRIPADRDTYFAHYTPDHIIVTMGVSPSVLRGGSYWTTLYWPGDKTNIVATGEWQIQPSGTLYH